VLRSGRARDRPGARRRGRERRREHASRGDPRARARLRHRGLARDRLRIEPEGTVLELPAQATIRADFIDLPAGARVSIAQLASGDGVATWMPLESARDASSGDVTVAITRFAPLAVVVSEEIAPGTGIRGRITWGEGSPAAGAPVQLFEGTTMLTTVTADADGAFAFTDLATGSYRLVVDYECHLDVTVEVRAGGVTERDLVLCGGS
jgi:hypothetical protein